MRCVDCQFHLLCHAGRLDSWSGDQQSIVILCPKCNRLTVGQHQTLYVFACEQRCLSSVAREWAEEHVTILDSAQIDDPGPGLLSKLTLAYCAACLDILPPQMRNITIKYLDENKEETMKKRKRQQYEEAVSAEEDKENDE